MKCGLLLGVVMVAYSAFTFTIDEFSELRFSENKQWMQAIVCLVKQKQLSPEEESKIARYVKLLQAEIKQYNKNCRMKSL